MILRKNNDFLNVVLFSKWMSRVKTFEVEIFGVFCQRCKWLESHAQKIHIMVVFLFDE